MDEIKNSNFIHDIIDSEIENGTYRADEIHTRFPPEPNGYLHIGSVKAICINTDVSKKYGGLFNLRYDDTNPAKESDEFVRSIREDLEWLGATPTGGVFYGSDYFGKCYEFAVQLIKQGDAYVCDLSKDDLADYKGTDRAVAGKESPYRNRSVEENLELFERMKNGEFEDGARTLRAKIDPSSDNPYLRDPVIYRIKHIHHHRQADEWCVYPMYDFAHPLCDAMQGVTYSICTLEFEDHRPLYNWVVENTEVNGKPRQIEFARLNITNTVMSKRYLKKMVDEKVVSGWDDPRMPTLTGLRNRGVPANALKKFCEEIGVAKANSEIEISYLEHFIRDDLNQNAERAMTVFNPIKVVITDYDGEEVLDFDKNPNDENAGKRKITFSNELYIDRDDFSLCPPPKYFRLQKGGVVRLKNAYIIRCEEVITDDSGEPVELRCTHIPTSKSGSDTSGVKCKGTIHWVNAKTCKDVEIRKYQYLLKDAEYAGQDFSERLNYDSLEILNGKTEEYLSFCEEGSVYQMMRKGYYKLFKEGEKLILSEIVGLKDSFNK